MNIDILIICNIIIGFSSVIALVIATFQIVHSRKSHNLSNIILIYTDILKIRQETSHATQLIEKLENEIEKKTKSFLKIYYKDKYHSILRCNFYYEGLGLMIKRKCLKFELVFEMISFPYEYWYRMKKLISIARSNGVKDFCKHFEYLEFLYNRARSSLYE
jgi:hypothetical protein